MVKVFNKFVRKILYNMKNIINDNWECDILILLLSSLVIEVSSIRCWWL